MARRIASARTITRFVALAVGTRVSYRVVASQEHMLPTVQGIYRDGKIELHETPANVAEETRVIVTFLAGQAIVLKNHGIDEGQAAELRARLATFAKDWDSPEMALYDNYDAAKAKLLNN